MGDRGGIFLGDNPLDILRRWMADAEKSEPSDANAMTLATVDASGLPDLRIVLVKQIDADCVTFYSNYQSAKGVQLAASGKAAVNFHWKSLARQVRLRGTVEQTNAEISDAYFHSRPLGSRIGAWASAQSRPLASRDVLVAELRDCEARYEDDPPRPPHWGGYKISPLQVEFWSAGEYRLHDRFLWSREAGLDDWDVQRLSP